MSGWGEELKKVLLSSRVNRARGENSHVDVFRPCCKEKKTDGAGFSLFELGAKWQRQKNWKTTGTGGREGKQYAKNNWGESLGIIR